VGRVLMAALVANALRGALPAPRGNVRAILMLID
jgi:hypothetical protein